jgi:pimeloyl-ACP methyl ester carboxylesterase
MDLGLSMGPRSPAIALVSEEFYLHLRTRYAEGRRGLPEGKGMNGKKSRAVRVIAAIAIIAAALALAYLISSGTLRKMDEAARASVPGSFVALSAGTIHYELAGPADGQPVVLIHGFSVPAYIWDGTFQSLGQAGYRAIRYDLYGRGYSDRPEVAYDRALFTRQLAELLDALGIARADLVGLSMGASVAASFADEYPNRVRRIVLMDPAPSSPPPLSARLLSAPILGDFVMTVFGRFILPSGQKSDFHDERNMPAGYLERYAEQMRYRGFIPALLSTVRNLYAPGYMEAYARIGAKGEPILLLWGRDDTTAPFADSEAMRKLMPRAEFRPIPDAGHLPHIERSELTLGLLTEFLGNP